MTAFSVAVTDASSRNNDAPLSLFVVNVKKRPRLDTGAQLAERQEVGIDRPAANEVPAGAGRSTLPLRARSGPANRIDRGPSARDAGGSPRA